MYEQPPRPPRPDWSESARKLRKNVGLAVGIGVIAVAVLVVMFSSVFTLNSGEEAVITRFGQYQSTISEPGLQFKIPFVDTAHIVNVAGVRRLEFGARTVESDAYNNAYQNAYTSYTDVTDEALMLTQEENLVLADWVVQYNIVDSYNYLFKVEDPVSTLRIIGESAYRRVTASRPLDDILTNQKESMQTEIATDLQEICNKYELGVRISAVQLQDAAPPDPVKDAFLDVTNAIEEKNAKINEASKYANEKLPLAHGQAEALINEAEGYREKRVNEAEGTAARYASIEREYAAQPDIMRTRLYMEMIREVLPKVRQVYFVDDTGNTLQFLPLSGDTLKEVTP